MSKEAGQNAVKWESVFSGQHDRRKVTDWVYEELKTAILDLALPPGEALREATIAERLGVSKTPVREALTRLEQEGLVETTSFKGAVVSSYSRRDLVEIYELRLLLEGAAARTAADSISDEDLQRLEGLVEESRRLRDKGDMTGLAQLLGDFDSVVFAQVKNQRINALTANLRAHLNRIGQLTADIPGRLETSVEQHESIVKAIRDRDPDQAERVMRSHIKSVMEDQLEATSEPDPD
jgi:GntR family transcriptional regulator, trigonelline degradation regulator